MTKQFKLLYRGAIAPDQHQAVVRGKLQALLKTSDEQTEVMFSGKPVIVKKSADETTAKRYQGAFAKAGAVLEVLAVVAQAEQSAPEPATKAPAAADTTNFVLAAAGEDLLAPNERQQPVVTDVETDHLSLAFPGQDLSDAEPDAAVPVAPNTDHLTLDALGVLLSDAEEASIESAVMAVEFDLAEVGATLVESRADEVVPAAPDTAHLSLSDVEPAPDA